MKRKVLTALFFVLLVVGLAITMMITVGAEEGNVAKVGNTEYATIDEALAAWANNTTLTLLADVTLPDTVQLKSTEHHILALGTHTLTAAEGKNAFEIVAYGRGDSEQNAITITADSAAPGGIKAGSKSIVYYDYSKGQTTANDRPVIKIEGGVFEGSTATFGAGGGIYVKGTAARKCATINISGGTFYCTIRGVTKSKLLISGGVFHYSVYSQGDSTACRLISGGTFKSISGTADSNNTKFWIGTAMGTSDVGVYINADGYMVVGGPVITEPGTTFEASGPATKWSTMLAYSSASTNGLYYTSASTALSKNQAVTLYTDNVDMSENASFKGSFNLSAENSTLSVTVAADQDPQWTVTTSEENTIVLYTKTISGEHEVRNYYLATLAAVGAANGTVAAGDPEAGNTSVVIATPNAGYFVKELKIYKTGDESTAVPLTNGVFEKPDYDITVSVVFELITYQIWIDGVQITDLNTVIDTSDSANITAGSASYDPDTNTLTLNGFSFVSDGNVCIRYAQDLNIRLVGASSIRAGSTAAVSCDISGVKLYLYSDSSAASLAVAATAATPCIVADSVQLENCLLTVSAAGTVFCSDVVIITDGNMEISCGTDGLIVGFDTADARTLTLDGTHRVLAGEDKASATVIAAPTAATYAQNTYIKVEKAHIVTLSYGTGSASGQMIVRDGEVVELRNPVIDGYIFMGWYADADYETPFDPAASIGEDVTVYAKLSTAVAKIEGPISDGLTDTYTFIYTDGTTETFTVVNGTDAKTAEFRVQGEWLQWRYTIDAEWKNLINIAELKGKDGKGSTLKIENGELYMSEDGGSNWKSMGSVLSESEGESEKNEQLPFGLSASQVIIVLLGIVILLLLLLLLKRPKPTGGKQNGQSAPVAVMAAPAEAVAAPVAAPIAPVTEEAPAAEEAVQEAAVAAPAPEEAPAAEPLPTDPRQALFASFGSKPTKSFAERLKELDPETKAVYERIKTELLSYRKVKARFSQKVESFRAGRKLLAKVSVAGKTVKCYFALDPAAYDTKTYRHTDASARKTYADVPMLVRVRSKLSVKRTVQLIAELAKANELTKSK